MIDISTAANIAEIAGGVAIVFSLMYAGFQIQQSNRMAKAQSIRAMISPDFLDQHKMGDIGRALNDFESLDFDAKWNFHSYFMRFFSHYEQVIQTNRIGLIDDYWAEAYSRAVAETLATPGGRQYWEGGARDIYEQSSVKHIEDYIRKNSESTKPYNQYMSWMTNV